MAHFSKELGSIYSFSEFLYLFLQFDIEEKGLPPNTTAVVNLAGQNVLDPTRRWTEGFEQNVWNSRVRTTAILNKAIRKAKNKPQAFVTISGVGTHFKLEHYVT